jgi:PAS domain S-box-containing protein
MTEKQVAEIAGATLSSGGGDMARRILESTADAFQLFDADWHLTHMNPVARQFWVARGMDPDAMLGRHFWDELFPGAMGGETALHMFRAMNERVPAAFEHYYAPWGIWLFSQFDPLPDGGLANYYADISEEKRTEANLWQSETLLAEAQRLAQIGSWNFDLVSDTVQWSDEHYRLFGLRPQETTLTYEVVAQNVHPDDRKLLRKVTARALRDHQPFEYNLRTRPRDGLERVLCYRGRVVLGEHGVPVRMFGTAQDITERVAAEKAQRALQRERDEVLRRLQLQFEQTPIACLIADPQSRIMDWNPAAELTFGYRRDEIVGTDIVPLLVPPEWRPHVAEVFRQVADGHTLAPAVHENITKDGRIIICEWRNAPLRDADGEVVANLAMAQDITERVAAERALRESEERYRSLTTHVKAFAIFSTDEHGVVTSWNEGCQQVLGYSEAEFVGMDSAELYTPEDRADGIPSHELRGGAAETTMNDRWMVGKKGRRFFAMSATAALRASDGRLMGFSTVLRDVTERKRYQDQLESQEEWLERLVTARTDELERTTERLRRSERMASLGTLAAGLGHDVGNLLLPLEVRLGFLDRAELGHDLSEHVGGIRKCVDYLRRLSNGLQLLALDPGAARSPEATELSEWWNDVSTIIKNVLPDGVQFDHDFPAEPCRMTISPVALTQAAFNLVQNAVDAMRERGFGHVILRAVCDHDASSVVLEVVDDGPGMLEEVVSHCMEPYFSTKTRGVTTGMGLSMVHGMVEAVGGRVEIESTVGRGTTVRLHLPMAARTEALSVR